MLYVQQSLTPNEKIVHVGQFHWSYTAGAVSWLFIGALFAYLVLHVSIHIDISSIIDREFPFLSEDRYGEAWRYIIDKRGGLLQVILDQYIGVRIAALVMFLFGVLMCVKILIFVMVTEICVTNQRLIYKTGLVSRYVGEISVDRIEGINVIQSILGRILGFGRIIVRGMGVGEVAIPPIANPIMFRRAIEKAKSL